MPGAVSLFLFLQKESGRGRLYLMKICNKIRILLIENDIDFVYLIRNTIEHTEDIHFCTYAETALAGLELARSLNPDIVLTDLNLSGNQLDRIGVSRKIRLSTNAKVLLLT